MSTLEARYMERIANLTGRILAAEKDVAASAPGTSEYAAAQAALDLLKQQETEYMLQSAPFIREYMSPAATTSATASTITNGLEKFVTVTSKTNRNKVFQQYLMAVENEASEACVERESNQTVCPACDVGMLIDARESVMVCPQCAVQKPYVGLSEANLSYQEEISQNIVSSFSYKRLNHFSEWLNSIQAKMTTEIPQETIDAIKAEFKKSRTSTRKEITPSKVRQYMKKLNLNKLYEHAHYVCTLINGIPAPRLEPELEERLKYMFVAIQEPFERAIKDTPRKNFLSYSFVLYKFCELLGRDDLLCHFSLLKSAEKLYQQDVIWKKICNELDWEFIRSI